MPGTTPVEGIPLPAPADKSGRFLAWPSPKALITWLALGGAVLTAGGFVFIRTGIYDVDKSAQASVNAKVDTAQAVVTVQVGALQKQVEEHIKESKEQRTEQKQDAREMNAKLDTLLRRR